VRSYRWPAALAADLGAGPIDQPPHQIPITQARLGALDLLAHLGQIGPRFGPRTLVAQVVQAIIGRRVATLVPP
jgi:hypothetical protein